MSWSSLPYDVVELILSNMSLIELARSSPTCGSFQTVYCKRMAVQQKSRLDLAEGFCGRERISCIVALIAHLLSGKALKRDFGAYQWNRCWISADGVLCGPVLNPSGSQFTFETGDFCVMICPNKSSLWLNFDTVKAHNSPWSYLEATIRPESNGVKVSVFSSHDEDLRPVAMVQAMLSGGLAQFLQDAGKWAEIQILPSANSVRASAAGLKAQITPLLPFASRYMPADRHLENWEIFGERMQVGVEGSGAHSKGALERGGRFGRVGGSMPQYALIQSVAQEGTAERMLYGWRSLVARLSGGWQDP